jgi:chromosome segregation ATPase
MVENTYKSYDKIKSKLRSNFEDVKYLVALHLQLLNSVKTLSEKVDRLQSSVTSLSVRIDKFEKENEENLNV